MGILDQVRDTLGGGSTEGKGNTETELLKGVLGMLGQGQGGSGGLANLVKGFQAHGLGEIISSWISTGENLPISPQQIQQGLGQEQLQQLASKVGLSPEAARTILAQVLPGFIDKLTPNGQIPQEGLLEQGLRFLKGKLG